MIVSLEISLLFLSLSLSLSLLYSPVYSPALLCIPTAFSSDHGIDTINGLFGSREYKFPKGSS